MLLSARERVFSRPSRFRNDNNNVCFATGEAEEAIFRHLVRKQAEPGSSQGV